MKNRYVHIDIFPYMKYAFIFLFLLLFSLQHLFAEEYEVLSPDGKLKVKLTIDNGTQYEVWHGEKQLIDKSLIALNLDNGTVVGGGTVKESTKKEINEIIPVLFGKNKTLNDIYNELTIYYNNDCNINFRIYDDGVAYRFSTSYNDSIIIKTEDAIFNFAGNPSVYFPAANTLDHWEKTYDKYNSIAEIKGNDAFAVIPLLLTYPETNYKVALLEAGLFDYPGLYIQKNGDNSLKGMWAQYPDSVHEPENIYSNHRAITTFDYIARTSGERAFPWRVIIVSDDDKSLLNNELVYKLAEPNRLDDVSWIEPGLTAWEWGHKAILEGVDFPSGGGTVNLSFQLYKYYVDFAAANDIPYLTLDAGWSEGYLRSLCTYARQKNVKIMVWTWASCALEYQWSGGDWLQRMKSFGVSGVKIDFFNRADQPAMNWAERLAKRCAELEMIAVYHGCPVPTGLHRTYPNILNYEAVRGLENNYWDRTASPDYNLEILFIRMLAGPFDYTPGSMHNVTQRQFRPIDTGETVPGTIPNAMGTRCHHLGMYILYDQPVGYLVDSPTEYEKYPDILDYFSKVPTVWDKTVPLAAELGKYAVVAKQKGDEWYVGGMGSWEGRNIDVNFSFLKAGQKYDAVVFRDSSSSNSYPKRYVYEKLTLDSNSNLNIFMADGGGFVIHMIPKIDTGVDVNKKNDSLISVYIDPYNNTLNVKAEELIKHIKVFNTSGQLLLNQNITGNSYSRVLNISNLKEGVYIVEVKTENTVDSLKFIY